MLPKRDLSARPLLNKVDPESLVGNMDSHSDPLVKDKKVLPLSDTANTLPIFFVFLLILTPLWLCVVVPLVLVVKLFGATFQMGGSNSVFIRDPMVAHPKSLVNQIVKKSSEIKERVYDIVIFGATGFTGKLAAKYIAKQYGNQFKWAIAGRRYEELLKIKEEMMSYNSDIIDIGVIYADSNDISTLNALVSQTKVVITTAGPFAKYGGNLVKSCVLHGTHYCDITGESDWVREMIDKYDDAARVSGARIVSFCGHDCVPWDLSVLECSNFLKKKGESLVSIHFYDELNSSPSGGTIDTIFHSLNNRLEYRSFLGFDPLLKNLQGGKSINKISANNYNILSYSNEYHSWVGPFVMAMVMANCIRRSNALNNYSKLLYYQEGCVYPSFFAGYINFIGLLLFATSLMFSPLQWLMQKFLPKPGQGPSESDMDAGFLKITGIGLGSGGTKVHSVFYFPTDPGYRDTARMLVESGLVLALQGHEIKVGGGLFTPAACQGDLLLHRLVNTGSTFYIR